MAPKWYEEAKKRLEADDNIQKNYEGYLDEKFGYLVISNKKVMFVREKGLLRKTVMFDLDLPYEEIDKIGPMGDRVFNITEKSGKRHVFRTDVLRVKKIENLLIEQMA